MHPRPKPSRWLLFVLCMTAVALSLQAAVLPDTSSSPGADLAFRHPDLFVLELYQEVDQLPAADAAQAHQRLAELGIAPGSARVDRRTGRFGTLLSARPLIPGNGVGNSLRWADLKMAEPTSRAGRESAAWTAFADFLAANQDRLQIDVTELSPQHRVVAHGDGVVQIHAPRTIDGIPVRGSYLTAVVNNGNMVLFGARHWGDRGASSNRPQLSEEEALAATEDYVASLATDGSWGKAERVYVSMANGHVPADVAVGKGLRYQLAWSVKPRIAGDLARWELLLDAYTGEALAFEDRNVHATPREVRGGVYPVSNDGTPPDGVEQAGWPMPFLNVSTAIGTQTTDSGGNVPIAVDGNISSGFSGPFATMNDNCGVASLTSAGDLDFGASGGDDCITPGFGGAGNTHSSRTGFYELNRLIESARAQLPSNTWLQQTLVANMNINQSCNAFWGGGTVNFYRSGGGCGNTGEIAAIFDHEWGHGMDDNDANGIISNPGESLADIYAALRLNIACIGRGFSQGSACGGYGDPCISGCDGVRDIDFANHASGAPHTIANYVLDTQATANGGCQGFGSQFGPCGGETHCEGMIGAETGFDLIHRDFPASGFDANTSLELATRLTFLGSGTIGNWYTCNGNGNDGCNAAGGYLNYLAADDDNGNVNDGTPHMAAIFAAFDRHGIACNSPTVQNSGCAGAPTTAPSVSVNPLDKSASLSWGAVAGATKYQIFRADGVFGCDFGKVKVGETTSTAFTDSALQNGREYSYVVIPIGTNDTCMGPGSSCATVIPAAGPNMDVNPNSAVLAFQTGDGDQFLDNCETATMTFDVVNTGLGTLTNARIVNVTAVSHPSISFITTFPSSVSPSTLGEGATGSGSFQFTADGLSFNDTVTFQVEVTADELSPITKFQDLVVSSAESDFLAFASKTFTFESGTEDWQTIQGTFNRTSAGGGAQGTTWYEASSANLDDQCDQIQSPVLQLQSTSTLTLWNQYDIEPVFAGNGQWYDRANIGVVAGGTRTAVSPDGGRLYDASGANGTCGTTGQPGWADANVTWGSSTWSAGALGSAGFAGQNVQLDVRYGTDAVLNGFGFHFDQVTLTDVSVQGPDGQSNTCTGCTVDADCTDGLFCNGAEVCNAGTCEAGTPPNCDDGVACTDDSCNEGTDSCDNTANDANCSNGLFCDGSETCDPVLDCQAGTPPNCDDLVGCTDDSCNEGTDSCDNVANDASCADGAFCNGAETCDPVLDCQAGSDPCPGELCDEVADVCFECNVDADCDDGLFCNGAETCNAGSCQAGSDPCPGQGCDEVGDVCTAGPAAQLEAACLTVGGTATTVALTNTYQSAVVVTSMQYASSTEPTVTRVSNVTATSFDVRLQNPSGGAVVAENVCYLVVEEGTWTIDGVAVEAQKYTSTVTDDAPSNWVGQPQSYGQAYTNPVVLGQVMSEADPNFSVFWCAGAGITNPPSATTLVAGKTVCEDTNVVRADETVGFVVFEAGHGTIGGVEFEAALGADTVLGVTNAPPYVYTFNTAFAAAPSVAVVQMAAVDGNNGGWAQVHGATMATATTLNLSIDEDVIADTERSHTSEQVGYTVFAGSVVFPQAGCVVDADCSNGLFCDGAETCNAGTCQAGKAPDCDDGVSCTVDSCNEGTDSCDNVASDALCSNGLFCDGAETCDPVLDCQAGTAPNCNDGVSCTADSCNEGTDSCDNVPNDGVCDDGQFCNGAETCDPVLDCQAGTDPCPGETCDEVGDVCVPVGPQAALEWGRVRAGAAAVTVNLTNTYVSPVVVTSIQYADNTTPVVTRISNVTATSFDVRIQGAGGGVIQEAVSYLVVEEGTWTVNGVNIEAQTYLSTVTDENNSWVGQAQSYAQSYTAPAVLGQVMSENDLDWSVFWSFGSARTNPPSATVLNTGKTVCEDTLVTRANETIGIVVFETAHGTLGGVEFESALGADTVLGVGNAPPYVYTFNSAFAAAPTVALVAMAGVDGGNGGWAQVHGASPTTATTLNLSIDEDTIGDAERSHISEQVGYVVFAAVGAITP